MEDSFTISSDDILLLSDVQNGFRNEYTEEAIQHIVELCNKYHFTKVVTAKFSNYAGSLFCNELNYFKMLSQEEQDFIPELKPFLTNSIVLHDGYGCDMRVLLAQLRIINGGILPKRILVAGFDTEACVLVIATQLFDNQIVPCILKDCVASSQGTQNHEYGLAIMKTLFGSKNLL